MNAPINQTHVKPQNERVRNDVKSASKNNSKLELLLVMEGNIRKVGSISELRYLLANETKKLIPSDQILLHRVNKNGELKDIETVSSIATLDADAPILLWLNKKICDLSQGANKEKDRRQLTFAIPVEQAPGGIYPFAYVLHVPFVGRDKNALGAISFLKEKPFNDADIAFSKRIAETASHAISALLPNRFLTEKIISKPLFLGAAFVVFLALFIPLPLTILAPTTIIAHEPATVTSPLQGVIEHIAVQPNRQVKKGDLLFSLNKIDLQSSFDLAERNVAIADARYRRATQGAFKSADSKRELAITKAEYQMALAEKSNAASKLSLSEIRAKRDGVILFQSKEKWLGKPIETGERIMRIADPRSVRFKIDVAAADSIILKDGADVNIFLDSAPLKPVSASVETRSYEAELSSRNTLIFPMMAKAIETNNNRLSHNLRIGQRGTAQIYGNKEPLWFYLFRKPISAIRQLIGY